MEQGGLESCGGEDFEISSTKFPIGVFAGYCFSLFSQSNLTIYRARWLRQYCLITRSTTSSDAVASPAGVGAVAAGGDGASGRGDSCSFDNQSDTSRMGASGSSDAAASSDSSVATWCTPATTPSP